jgi:hypothetical protein
MICEILGFILCVFGLFRETLTGWGRVGKKSLLLRYKPRNQHKTNPVRYVFSFSPWQKRKIAMVLPSI